MTWGETYERVRELTGWTYAQIDETPLPALESLLNGGRRAPRHVFASQAEIEAAVRRWRGT